MEVKDVKEILDIPTIEDYLQNFFNLDLYEVGDKTIIYKSKLDNGHEIVIDMISDESLILGRLDLAEIISHYDDIGFFQFVIFDDLGEAIAAHMYRPKINDSEKSF